MTSRYFVTGCAGFIGANLTQTLLQQGHQVVGIDNLNDAYDPTLKYWRLDQFKSDENFRFHQADISERGILEQIFALEEYEFDAVFNLAARAGVRASVADPWVFQQTNLIGTLNLLECCRKYNIRKFILASTSSLYGNANSIPYQETDETNYPLSPYAASKKSAEALCYSYHHLYEIDCSILRYFTVYGPAGRPDMSVFRFVRAIALGQPITVFGDGKQKRDFTYIDDIVAGTIAAGVPLGFEVLNLGGDRTIQLFEMIEMIEELVGRRAVIRYEPAHPADARETRADISKANELLNWSPRVSLEEGLRRAVDWYRAHAGLANRIQTGEQISYPQTA